MDMLENLTGSASGHSLLVGTSIDPNLLLFPEICSINGYYVMLIFFFDSEKIFSFLGKSTSRKSISTKEIRFYPFFYALRAFKNNRYLLNT